MSNGSTRTVPACLMRALLIQPKRIPYLLICIHRSDSEQTSAALRSVFAAAQENPAIEVRELSVEGLSNVALVHLLEQQAPSMQVQLRSSRESLGSPFFVTALAGAFCLDRALDLVLSRPTPTSSYDITWVQGYRILCLLLLLRVREAEELLQPVLEDALARGDVAGSAALAMVGTWTWTARGKAEYAARQLTVYSQLERRALHVPRMANHSRVDLLKGSANVGDVGAGLDHSQSPLAQRKVFRSGISVGSPTKT